MRLFASLFFPPSFALLKKILSCSLTQKEADQAAGAALLWQGKESLEKNFLAEAIYHVALAQQTSLSNGLSQADKQLGE